MLPSTLSSSDDGSGCLNSLVLLLRREEPDRGEDGTTDDRGTARVLPGETAAGHVGHHQHTDDSCCDDSSDDHEDCLGHLILISFYFAYSL